MTTRSQDAKPGDLIVWTGSNEHDMCPVAALTERKDVAPPSLPGWWVKHISYTGHNDHSAGIADLVLDDGERGHWVLVTQDELIAYAAATRRSGG